MKVKKRGLGRGLDALLGGSNASVVSDEGVDAEQAEAAGDNVENLHRPPTGSDLRNLPIDLLQPGKYQPRTDMHQESLEELANSIRNQGVLQPIVVRKITGEKYEIVAGERRWRAAQLAELHEVPAIIKDIPDEAALAIGLIENIQRENLNPVEEATALQRLISDFEMTHQEAADAIGRSRAAVSNLLRLLSLTGEVREFLERGDLEMGHARALLSLDESSQVKIARDIVAKGLSVREAEKLVKRLRSEVEVKETKPKEIDPNTLRLQEGISEKLGAKVLFQHGSTGKGKLVIHYNNLDELDGILAHIK